MTELLTDFDTSLECWEDYISEHQRNFRAALNAAGLPEPCLLLLDARGRGKGWEAAVRLMRKSAPPELADYELVARAFPDKGRGIFAAVTTMKDAQFAVGADLCLHGATAIPRGVSAAGRRGWIACVGQRSSILFSVFYRRELHLLEGARAFVRKSEHCAE